ncbi:armadillo-type protein, partial [Blyttiomyces helicus]
MGKASKKEKKTARRNQADPLSMGPPVVLSSAEIAKEQRQEAIPPILKKLSAASEDDRAWAATALSNLVLDPESRRQLLAGNVIESLIALLTDLKLDVVVEGAGALRNLAVVGGEEVLSEILRKHALTPLLALIPKMSSWIAAHLSGTPATTAASEPIAIGLVHSLAEQVIALIWSLCESADSAVRMVNSAGGGVVQFLLDLMNPTYLMPWKLVLVAAQCLHTLTEENEGLYPLFASNPLLTHQLVSLASTPAEWTENRIILRVLSAAVLVNLRACVADQIAGGSAGIVDIAVRVVGDSLNYDIPGAIAEGAREADIIDKMPMPQATDGEEMDLNAVSSKESASITTLESHMGTIQLALELLANVYSDDLPEPDELVEDDDAVDDDAEDDDAFAMMQEDAEILVAEDGEAPASAPTAASATSIPTVTLIERVAPLTRLPARSASPSAAALAVAVGLVELRALGCLTNLVSAAGPAWFDAQGDVRVMWDGIFEVAHAHAAADPAAGVGLGGAGVEGVEGAVDVLWALARGVDARKGKAGVI